MVESNPKPKPDPFVTFIENGSLESDCSAGSRPKQLRPRPKAPQQTKNFPTKKSPISLGKMSKIL